MAMAPGAHGEFCSGREEEGRGLGRVEEGVGVLTVGGIELRWLGWGDRRRRLFLGKKNRGGGIRPRKKTSGVVRWFGNLGMAMEGGLGCLL